MDRYYEAIDNDDYERKAFEKAKKYYTAHQWEWYSIVSRCPDESMLAMMMLAAWEQTEEGRAFRNNWRANSGIRMLQGCLWLIIIVGIIVGAIALRIYFK